MSTAAFTAAPVRLSSPLAEPISTLYDAPELAGPLRGVALALIGQNMFNFVHTVFRSCASCSAQSSPNPLRC